MRTLVKIVLLLIIQISVNAQSGYPDSLKRALTHADSDSTRWKISLNIAYAYHENEFDSAFYYADQALLLARQNNKQLNEALALEEKGYILNKLGRFPESYRCSQQALKIAENAKSEHNVWLYVPEVFYFVTSLTPRIFRLFVLGNIQHDFGHLMEAIGKTDQQIVQYQEAQKTAEEIRNTDLLGYVDMNLGRAYSTVGKLDSALLLEENAAKIFIQIGDKAYLGAVYCNMGNIYMKKRDKAMAVQYFSKGIQSALEQNNNMTLHDIYNSLTHFYLSEEKNKDSSLYYARKKLSILQSQGSKDLGQAYADLSASYELNNKMDSAYKYKSLALISTNSSDKARIESLTKMQTLEFDEQLKLQELEKEKADTKNKIRTYGMLAGLGVFLGIGLILYRNNRQKQKANKVLETTLTNLKSTQSQLIQSEKMASLGELTAGIAHEIQNPLNFVNNFSEVSNELIDEMKTEFKKGDTEEGFAIADDIKQNLEKILHHGKRADAIVKGMLQHSSSGSGKKEPTNINALADEYLRLAYHGLRAKDKSFNATMITDYDETLGTINIIPQEIGRVILNLINNAFYAVNEKYASAGFPKESEQASGQPYEPTVSISTKKAGNKVLISVKDNGNGIPQKILDKVFQPFFTTKPTGQGTGLGLSLSYDIVKAHDGELKVGTKEGEGAEFIIELPLRKNF